MSPTRELGARARTSLRDKKTGLGAVVRGLRALVKQVVPDVRESVNPWGIPTFEDHGKFSYFMVHKSHITFGFHRGTSLKDPKGLLEGVGKNLRHVKIRSLEDLHQPGMRELIRSAAQLNRKDPQDPMGRKLKRT